MDADLAHNALRLQLADGGVLLPGPCVHELGTAHLVLLFATTAAVYRLVLPHPEAIAKVTTPCSCTFSYGTGWSYSGTPLKGHP